MNLVEKILARASGKPSVEPGEIVIAEVDMLLMHDLSGYLTSGVYDKQVGLPIPHPERTLMVFDHHYSPPTEQQADVLHHNREWARRTGINLLDCGNGNLHHAAVRGGFVKPGMIVVGSDSHTPVHGALGALAVALGNDSHAGTVLPYGKAWFRVPETVRIELTGEPRPGTTPRDIALWLTAEIGEGTMNYKALEFTGPYVKQLGFWDRWLFPLLCVDLGAKSSYVEPDEVTEAFVRTLPGGLPYDLPRGDGGEAATVLRYDVSDVVPQVACPPTVGNAKAVSDVAGRQVRYAELGGHGGGRIEDIRTAAEVLHGHTVHPDTRFNIVPSSREVFAQAVREGLVLALHEAGANWFPPSTGSNQAINMGAMAAGEAMISTHARNFPGRNGSTRAEMYLASARTVAASAVAGEIAERSTR
ncbi:3-isopropylmalate dehydratase large subunit [Streptomyces samsunensis]|uniref:3-isopropylmalate dehydratase large subunit n=1 Tax=Streptomyces TaxID=1883 RepID=UPI00081EC21E|nr:MULTISPECIES: aconitase family protein [Streptomyces]MYU13031.1 3-isopropylmalate dehydratase large subunit [Streptomyces sp. SID8361]NUH36415.1 3-isopropylmalate dehydratase large subunit [Streptomyces samsunensis]SCF97294.1 3-isopropylmalate/(R)-2-methylmalate dehydratase large subunit [Streptomyces sp. MnatMP-M27]